MIYIILTLSIDICLISGLVALNKYIKEEKKNGLEKTNCRRHENDYGRM